MLRGNFHTHTSFCDGRDTAREMAERAIEIGFTHLGFSGHMDPEIHMDLPAYDREIRRLQAEYAERIDLLRGVELDTLFVPRGEEEARLLSEMEYVIGSTHFIEAPSGGEYGTVDDTPERLFAFCREEFGGDCYRLSKAYYETEARVFEKTRCTFVGHFDLITCFNDRMHFLDEDDRRYRMPALETMEYLAALGLPFEINCGAVNRGRKVCLYPNRFLLRELHRMGGEILINSDAHQKELLDGAFDIAVRTALECGFRHTLFLEHAPDGRVVTRRVPLADLPCR